MRARKRYSSAACAIMVPYCSAGMGRDRPTPSPPAAPVDEDVGQALPEGDPGLPAGQPSQTTGVPREEGEVDRTHAGRARPDLDRAGGQGEEAVEDILDGHGRPGRDVVGLAGLRPLEGEPVGSD